MNLKIDLRRIVIESLDAVGAEYDAAADLEKLLLAMLTVEERRIVSIPRKVHTTPEFDAAKEGLPKSEADAVDELLRKVERGDDINPHLNRRSLMPSQDDDLLIEWGLYHFHLSTAIPTGDRFVERTGLLAFAHFNRENAYFVDFRPHKNFEDQRLVELLIQRFPVVAEAHKIRGIQGLSQPPPSTPEEVRKLRKVHVNTPLIVDGQHYFGPGPGFVSSGHSAKAVMRMNSTLREIERLERTLSENLAVVQEAACRINTTLKPDDLDFGLVCEGKEWLVLEKKTRTAFRFQYPSTAQK